MYTPGSRHSLPSSRAARWKEQRLVGHGQWIPFQLLDSYQREGDDSTKLFDLLLAQLAPKPGADLRQVSLDHRILRWRSWNRIGRRYRNGCLLFCHAALLVAFAAIGA